MVSDREALLNAIALTLAYHWVSLAQEFRLLGKHPNSAEYLRRLKALSERQLRQINDLSDAERAYILRKARGSLGTVRRQLKRRRLPAAARHTRSKPVRRV